jgi:hypothetical protein
MLGSIHNFELTQFNRIRQQKKVHAPHRVLIILVVAMKLFPLVATALPHLKKSRERMRSTNVGLSPAASAGISVLLVATVALGVIYYAALQRDAHAKPLEFKKSSTTSPKKSKGGRVKKNGAAANAAVKKAEKQSKRESKKPAPVAVRILYGTQTGTSKSTLDRCSHIFCAWDACSLCVVVAIFV